MTDLWLKMLRSVAALFVAIIAITLTTSALQATPPRSAAANTPVVLAAYQAWHGLSSHNSAPYSSTDPLVISRHIQQAKAQGISGFVIDWYGKPISSGNYTDRAFIDLATTELFSQAAQQQFTVALMYDAQTVAHTAASPDQYTSFVITDLLYARRYFTLTSYLIMSGHPAIFVYPSQAITIDWDLVRSAVTLPFTLLDKDPNPYTPDYDAQFDGFYVWVQPTASTWSDDGSEWGQGYLTWFYNVMTYLAPTYTTKVAVGGVWPGFDDSPAAWGHNDYMWRRCGGTWRDTWQIANQYQPPYIMIDTWNDFEEGTDIEFGIGECLLTPQQQTTFFGRSIVYTHLLSNSGKFTDTFTLQAQSGHGWPVAIAPTSAQLLSHTGTLLTFTLTVPLTPLVSHDDVLYITATSQLSPSVLSTLTDTTTVRWGTFLPMLRRE